MILNPTNTLINKDNIRVQLQILPKQTQDYFTLPDIDGVASYMHFNREALKIQKGNDMR